MARQGSDTLTDREAQIMEVVWSHGDASAEQIRDLLPDRPHDSTVRTLLRILEAKGYLKFRSNLEKYTTDRDQRFHNYEAIPPPIVIRLRTSPDPK